MNLSYRLTEVKNMVAPCATVCDIGCDHGYVSLALVKEKKASKVIACDVNNGPLEAAKRNIESENLTEYIETRLGDGLHKVDVGDAPDAIVIAGMGGRLMERILSEGIEVVNQANQLVLQPQSELFLVRRWIRNNGFYIEREKALIDEGKYYFIIDARKGTGAAVSKEMESIYDTYSRYLIETKDSVLKEYLLRTLSNNHKYLEGIKDEGRAELISKNELIEKVLKLMD